MKKDTLSLTKLIQNFKSIIKDRLFYDRYEYCFCFTLAEANVLRGLKHELIDSRLNQRIEWREMARQRWPKTSEGTFWNTITDQVREDLHTICEAKIGRAHV